MNVSYTKIFHVIETVSEMCLGQKHKGPPAFTLG